MALTLTGLRLVHLSADMPDSLWSASLAEFVDEGAKTLSARNLSLFGKTHWHPGDEYYGWLDASPVTQLLYYGSFRWLGARIEAARLVTIFWFLLLLIAFASLAQERYSFRLALLGLLLLGLAHPLFLFSRSALFEVPILVCLYGLLFGLHRIARRRPGPTLLLAAAVCLFVTLGIKRSALLYFVPVLFVLALGWVSSGRSALQRFRAPALWLTLIAVAGLLARTQGLWSARMRPSLRALVVSLFASPLMESAPLILCLGLFAAALLLLGWNPGGTQRPFPLTLLALVLLSPPVIGFFGYLPLRYFIPLLPAYPLLLLECWREQPWANRDARPAPKVALALGFLCLVLATASFLHFVNRFPAALLPLEPRAAPGYAGPVTLLVLIPLSIVAGFGLWLGRRRLLQPRTATRVLSGLAVLALLIEGLLYLQFVRSPSFERRDLAGAIEHSVAPGAAVIGDFAPYLTLGSRVPALYSFKDFNHASRITNLRPGYFLFSDISGMRTARQLIRANPDVELRAPIVTGTFRDISVRLYPLEYRQEGYIGSPEKDSGAESGKRRKDRSP